MPENNWKRLWSGRTADQTILRSGDPHKIFMELKRTNGFDVIKDQISYESFLGQYREMTRNLSLHLPDSVLIQSVFEVGCGSGQTCFCLNMTGSPVVGSTTRLRCLNVQNRFYAQRISIALRPMNCPQSLDMMR